MLKFVIAYTESGRDLKQAQIIQPVSRTQVKHRRAYISGWRLEAGGWRLEAGGWGPKEGSETQNQIKTIHPERIALIHTKEWSIVACIFGTGNSSG